MPVPVRTEVVTTDPEEAHALVAAAYCDNRLRVSGSLEGFRYEHSRYDIGPVRFDTMHHTLTTDYQGGSPLGCLVVCRVLDRAIDIQTEHLEGRFGRGEVFLCVHPERDNHHTTMHGTRLQITGLDLPLLHKVAGDTATPAQLLSRLRYGQPLPPAAARHWQHTVDYLTGLLRANPAAEASPLVLGAAGQLLAAVLLGAATTDPAPAVPADRGDATPMTVRRAVAYIETNPDLDLGLADIARAASVTPRALQLAFRRHLDTTPMAYLRRVRLDRAHQDLSHATPADGTTVTTVAARWGFAHPGRFATHYRATYGQAPSTTLHT